MAKPPLSHYSPIFANKAWADNDSCISYFSCPHSQLVKKSLQGRKQWGRKRGLYKWSVECALDKELENEAGPIYEKLLSCNEPNSSERIIWAQFLLSQLVRTPTFIKYEHSAKKLIKNSGKPRNDRVGCRECQDLNFIANRDWCLLIAHEDDFFVRTDNPVLQSGFIERSKTCLFYPLSPRLCFVACSMPEDWNAFLHVPKVTCGYNLKKGGAHRINFYHAKAAGETLIISPEHEGEIADRMFIDVLGKYPQPPFPLHSLAAHTDLNDAYESIRIIMSKTDNIIYPSWLPFEFEPYYQINKKADIS